MLKDTLVSPGPNTTVPSDFLRKPCCFYKLSTAGMNIFLVITEWPELTCITGYTEGTRAFYLCHHFLLVWPILT